jgi:hypothetical protein
MKSDNEGEVEDSSVTLPFRVLMQSSCVLRGVKGGVAM